MKKLFLFFAVAAMFIACGPKAQQEAEEDAIIGEEVILDEEASECDGSTAVIEAEETPAE